MAQSVKHLILDLGSGHDFTVCEFKPGIGLCIDSAEPGWDSLSFLSLLLPCSLTHMCGACALSLSLCQNKLKKWKIKESNTIGYRNYSVYEPLKIYKLKEKTSRFLKEAFIFQ